MKPWAWILLYSCRNTIYGDDRLDSLYVLCLCFRESNKYFDTLLAKSWIFIYKEIGYIYNDM
jgi:hypothetical protein